MTMKLDEYKAAGGNICPCCKSCDITGEMVEIEAGTAWQHVSCNDCGAAWRDDYTLTGFEVTEE